MFQITFVAEIITEIEAITVMLENTLTLPSLHNSHTIHNACKIIYTVCYCIKGCDEGMCHSHSCRENAGVKEYF